MPNPRSRRNAWACSGAPESRRDNRGMIGRITGTLAEKSPPQLLIDVNGVGYEVDIGTSTS